MLKGTQRVSSFPPRLCHVSFSYALLGDHDENNLNYNEDTGDELSFRCPIINEFVLMLFYHFGRIDHACV